ncbi:MAG: hypothetical protein Q7S92_06275 [Candidatus Diapherotrites archaeon]|nr:hypothetical protein [Candidatus Diapherotrites archaeon]
MVYVFTLGALGQVFLDIPFLLLIPLIAVWGIFKRTKATFALSLVLSTLHLLVLGFFFFFPFISFLFSKTTAYSWVDLLAVIWLIILLALPILIFFSKQSFGLSKLSDLKLPDLKLASLGFLVFLIFGFVFLSSLIIVEVGSQTQPISNASSLIQNSVNNLYTPKTSSRVVFKSNDSMNTRAIATASQTGLLSNQIVLSLGDFSQDSQGFSLQDGIILYSSSSSKNVRLWAVCDSKTNLRDTVQQLSPFDNPPQETCSGIEEAETCCLIALRKVN